MAHVTVRSAGDLGDCIAALSVIHDAGHTADFYLVDRPTICKPMQGRSHLIIPLFESQPYIKSCRFEDRPVDWPAEAFRMKWHKVDRNLAESHAWHAKEHGIIQAVSSGKNKWLTVDPSPISAGRVVIARSDRYHGAFFRWHDVVAFYGAKLLFIGLPSEHERFCGEFGPVQYQPTADLLEAAQIIAGSDLFIGNQTSTWWLAEGLKHPRIQETALEPCDSICGGGEAMFQYVVDGAMELPLLTPSGIARQFEPLLPYTRPIETIDTSRCPPNGWHYKGMSNTSLQALVLMAKRAGLGDDHNKLRLEIIESNVKRRPDFFSDDSHIHTLSLYRNAMAQQGLSVKNATEPLP